MRFMKVVTPKGHLSPRGTGGALPAPQDTLPSGYSAEGKSIEYAMIG
jgi:hypothetical protein